MEYYYRYSFHVRKSIADYEASTSTDTWAKEKVLVDFSDRPFARFVNLPASKATSLYYLMTNSLFAEAHKMFALK